jgi:hypothetical protein
MQGDAKIAAAEQRLEDRLYLARLRNKSTD